MFRTGAGTKLNASMMRIVAMQFDEIDASRHTGWSVLVQGTARWLYEEQDPVEVDTWAPGPRPYVVRVTPVHVSGRRIQLHQMDTRSEEHTSELQSLMRISYAVFCLK